MIPDQPANIENARGLVKLPARVTPDNAKATIAKLVASEKAKDKALEAAEQHHSFVQKLFNKE